jgi:hypothetical protein
MTTVNLAEVLAGAWTFAGSCEVARECYKGIEIKGLQHKTVKNLGDCRWGGDERDDTFIYIYTARVLALGCSTPLFNTLEEAIDDAKELIDTFDQKPLNSYEELAQVIEDYALQIDYETGTSFICAAVLSTIIEKFLARNGLQKEVKQ